MFNSVKHAKRLLLGQGTCMECKHTKDLWLLADDLLKCTKTRSKMSMNYTCLRWKKADNDKIYQHTYYHRKYVIDRKFFETIKKTQEMIDEWKRTMRSKN